MLDIEIKASSRYPIRRKLIKKVIEKTLKTFKVNQDVLVEINIVGDRKMTQLHKKYMNLPGTTDVLSFPLQEDFLESKKVESRPCRNNTKEEVEFLEYPDNILRLGTIFVSYPQAQKQANSHYMSIDEEVNQLVEHGIMHLLGIHHE